MQRYHIVWRDSTTTIDLPREDMFETSPALHKALQALYSEKVETRIVELNGEYTAFEVSYWFSADTDEEAMKIARETVKRLEKDRWIDEWELIKNATTIYTYEDADVEEIEEGLERELE